MSYRTSYVIVAGIAWLRRSRIELRDGTVEDRIWCVTFGRTPVVRTGDAGDSTPLRGEIDGIDWELELVELAPPFETPNRVMRRFAPSHLVTSPALAITGRVGDVSFEHAPGHSARHWGKRHAESWGWAHASTPDGRWVSLLSVVPRPFPRMSQVDGRLARGSVEGARMRAGKYEAEAPVESFVRLEYRDTDGSSLWCYHSEKASIVGPKGRFEGAALEVAVREPIPGWPA